MALRSIHNKPSTSKSQPMGWWGRLEAIRAPTRGKARKDRKTSVSLTVSTVTRSLGHCAEEAGTESTMMGANMVTERPASDQASHAGGVAAHPTDSSTLFTYERPRLSRHY